MRPSHREMNPYKRFIMFKVSIIRLFNPNIDTSHSEKLSHTKIFDLVVVAQPYTSAT